MSPPYGAFAHLRTENVDTYRGVLRAFVAAKRRFTMHLRPTDVLDLLRRSAAEGEGVPTLEAIEAALPSLVDWGNLRAHPDTGRVTTVEDFHRARYLYQLTVEGEAAERALAAFDEALGRRGALQAVALADIATHLRALLALADDDAPDPARAHLALDGLVARFTALADNAQAFMGSLQRSIDLHGIDAEAFAAYKNRLVDYLERFIADLQTTGAEIASLVATLDAAPEIAAPDAAGTEHAAAGTEHAAAHVPDPRLTSPASPSRISALVDLVVAREASDLAPDGASGAIEATDADTLAWQLDLLRAAWHERWEGVRAWFLSAPARPSQAKLLRAQARAAVPALLQVVASLNERRQGRSDRSADFRRLALWFAQAPDDAARHRLWHTAFGLASVRHLSVDADTLESREDEPVGPNVSWADAPPLQISPQLRRTGRWERRGKPSAVVDRSDQRRVVAARLADEAAQTDAARTALVSDGPRRLSQLPELEPAAFALFLALLGSALARSRPGGGKVVATTGDGSLAIELEPVPDGGQVSVRTDHGTFTGPDHVLWVRELRPVARPVTPAEQPDAVDEEEPEAEAPDQAEPDKAEPDEDDPPIELDVAS